MLPSAKHLTAATMLATLASAASAAGADTAPATGLPCCAVVELRQYITLPGRRDQLIKLFEDRFVEPQEQTGIKVIGQFRDVNDANHFTWMRGFPNMEARKQALTDFYFGPIWKASRNDANATIYDNDNVLLLRPASADSGIRIDPTTRPAIGAQGSRNGFVVATIYYFDKEATAEFIAHFNHALMPVFEKNGAHILGRYVTETSKNTFEQLPVREHDRAFVWIASFASRQAYEQHIAKLGQDAQWRDQLFTPLYKSLLRPPEVLMLEPAARSLVY